jgi:DNA recombination protein RmuC
MIQILFLVAGLLLGGLLAYFLYKSSSLRSEKELLGRLSQIESEKATLTERISHTELKAAELSADYRKLQSEYLALNTAFANEKMSNTFLNEKLIEQKSELENLQQKFTKEFENLANRILDEKSKKFVEQNRDNLDIILNPLKERIKEFENKIDTSYKAEAAERNSLKGEIKSLVELNKQISDEANNLARALKSDTKKQGNWGEVILERILERSGLVKDQEYRTQVGAVTEEGRRVQPDVVISLPDRKEIIIDSKVSLIAYEAMVNAGSEEEREKFAWEHVGSVKAHIKNLSDKNYQLTPGFTTPDFVLLFMPIESSFGIAVQMDTELFNYAWDKKIVIVSPSTLLATLRTIASIWKQEKQSRNAMEIARLSGALYDKFKGFVDDLIDVGKKMDQAKSGYADAMNKLTSGSGNILKRIEDIKKLGAKTSRELPAELVGRAEENS